MLRSLRRDALASLLGASLAVAGCGSDPRLDASSDEQVGRISSAILGSKASDATQDAVVMLVFSDPTRKLQGICTAALLAPRLVLTARHCVADTDADVICSADGTPAAGGAVIANHPPGSLYVFTGRDRPNLDPGTWKPAGRGSEVLDDGATNLCNHDLALILLEQPITGVPLATVRLDGTAGQGEQLTTVGWGVSSNVDEPVTRQQRSGVHVTRVGPDETSPTLTPNEFSFDESICLGDSGGPILDEGSGAVVGVVSRGGNGTSSATSFVSTCTMAVNLGTKIAPFKELLKSGYDRAGAQPLVEPPQAETTKGCRTAPGDGPGTLFEGALLVAGLVLLRRRAAVRAPV